MSVIASVLLRGGPRDGDILSVPVEWTYHLRVPYNDFTNISDFCDDTDLHWVPRVALYRDEGYSYYGMKVLDYVR